ncbi:hypothetical protein HJG60_009710 [Phyllostomus discolor]|uniref:Uncharacterized protein n=1 Tax=Phyllostomus discolor TaxID=89673 RepID=A0A834EL87_9CHIR|nr:hypothetical protein HJG60_009710 [Phyllostomus discolor]
MWIVFKGHEAICGHPPAPGWQGGRAPMRLPLCRCRNETSGARHLPEACRPLVHGFQRCWSRPLSASEAQPHAAHGGRAVWGSILELHFLPLRLAVPPLECQGSVALTHCTAGGRPGTLEP